MSLLILGVYTFGAAYLLGPLVGWGFDLETLAHAFGTLPAFVKGGVKAAVAFPFTFHTINGVRHLIWETGSGETPPPATAC
jgi:succinate dehydrogenase (ubiquinone) cytochrome b560 subunit